jgi:NAD(P)H dehydrogenase (quinone)
MRPTILVTWATGKTGGAVVEQLRAKDWPVRALVHRLDTRSERLQRLGAEVVVDMLILTRQSITSNI